MGNKALFLIQTEYSVKYHNDTCGRWLNLTSHSGLISIIW